MLSATSVSPPDKAELLHRLRGSRYQHPTLAQLSILFGAAKWHISAQGLVCMVRDRALHVCSS